jgi:hypothetical protein
MGLFLLHRTALNPDYQFRPKELIHITGWSIKQVREALHHFVSRNWIRHVSTGLYAIQNVYPAPWFWFWLDIDPSLWYRSPLTELEMWLDLYEHCQARNLFIAFASELGLTWGCSRSWAARVWKLGGDRIIARRASRNDGMAPTSTAYPMIFSLNREWKPPDAKGGFHFHFTLETFPFGVFEKIDPTWNKRPYSRERRRLAIVGHALRHAGPRREEIFEVLLEGFADDFRCSPETVRNDVEALIHANILQRQLNRSVPDRAKYKLILDPAAPFDMSFLLNTNPYKTHKRYTNALALLDLITLNQEEDPVSKSHAEFSERWNWGTDTTSNNGTVGRFIRKLEEYGLSKKGGGKGHTLLQLSFRKSRSEFPRRAKWLDEEMKKRNLSIRNLSESHNGPARNTVRSVLRAEPVSDRSLENIRHVLSQHGSTIQPSQIPND